MQSQSAPAGRARQQGHPRRRRHADGVQHDLRSRRRLDGDRGDEGVADQPRGRRRLDRAGMRGHLFDGLVCLVGCDKTIPAARWRWRGRHSRPRPLQRHHLSRCLQGQANATVVTVFEAIGAYRAGKISLEDLYEVENVACPGPGACGGQFTANTMSTVMEFIGLSPAGLNGIPAEDPAKDEAAHRSGELVMDLVRRDVRPSSSSPGRPSRTGSRRSRPPAAARTVSSICSAIAHEYGIPLDIDSFGAVADRTPIGRT